MEYNDGCLIDTENLPVMKLWTPFNVDLCGMYGRSFAYFSLKDRLPVIITQVIDLMARKGGAPEIKFIEKATKLKSDLITNKEYDPFTVDTPEAKKWNQWIETQVNKKYFNNTWLFTECYVYRRLYESCELIEELKKFDYFAEKKKKSFESNLRPMCLAADKVVGMLSKSEKDKRKADFISLLKLALWANKCDLSLSVGEQVVIGGSDKEENAPESKPGDPPPAPPPPPPAPPVPDKGKGKGKVKEPPKPPGPPSPDPFQMILDLKEKLLVDDTGKIADQVVTKAENMQKAIDGNTVFKFKCSCHRLAKSFGVELCQENVPPSDGQAAPAPGGPAAPPPGGAAAPPPGGPAAPPPGGQAAPPPPELPQIPCPAKMTIPLHVMFDIVCDNAGYELFADLCLAAFLLEQGIVQMIRFHVKKMPWFVSDVTEEDFQYVIKTAQTATFSGEIPAPPGAEGADGTIKVTATNLNKLGELWSTMLKEGKFVVMAEDYWTYPHPYCEMKKLDYNMYRKLQYAVGVLFKGDLNYRKLLADRNVNPYTGLEPNLQGFIPAPIIALRTVKSELVCGLPKGKFEVLNNLDPNWMRTGDYGVIQFCAKAEPLKPSDRPCLDYCAACLGVVCPEHTTDM